MAYTRYLTNLKKRSKIYPGDGNPIWKVVGFKYGYLSDPEKRKKIFEEIKKLLADIESIETKPIRKKEEDKDYLSGIPEHSSIHFNPEDHTQSIFEEDTFSDDDNYGNDIFYYGFPNAEQLSHDAIARQFSHALRKVKSIIDAYLKKSKNVYGLSLSLSYNNPDPELYPDEDFTFEPLRSPFNRRDDHLEKLYLNFQRYLAEVALRLKHPVKYLRFERIYAPDILLKILQSDKIAKSLISFYSSEMDQDLAFNEDYAHPDSGFFYLTQE